MAIDAIARNKAEALIREQLVNTIQQDVPKSSTVMQLGTRLANMTSNQTKIPVLSMLPLAYWVNGDTGMKKTSKQEWDNVYMTARTESSEFSTHISKIPVAISSFLITLNFCAS